MHEGKEDREESTYESIATSLGLLHRLPCQRPIMGYKCGKVKRVGRKYSDSGHERRWWSEGIW